MKVTNGLQAMQSSAATGGEGESEASITEAATVADPTVQNSEIAGPVREDEKKYCIEKLVGRPGTITGM